MKSLLSSCLTDDNGCRYYCGGVVAYWQVATHSKEKHYSNTMSDNKVTTPFALLQCIHKLYLTRVFDVCLLFAHSAMKMKMIDDVV